MRGGLLTHHADVLGALPLSTRGQLLVHDKYQAGAAAYRRQLTSPSPFALVQVLTVMLSLGL